MVGAVKSWHYFGDGRAYKSIIIRGTDDDTGSLCDFTSNDLLYDNSPDGSSERFMEGRQGLSIYFDPVNMSCIRVSTAGSSYYTTASNTGNHRTELEVWSATEEAEVKLYLERISSSTYAVGDDLVINVTTGDRSGNLISLAPISFSVPVTYAELPVKTNIVGGTDYLNTTTEGKVVLEVLDEFNDPVSGASCEIDYWGPSDTEVLSNQAMSELGTTGVYADTFTMFGTVGIYTAIANCTSGVYSDLDAHAFQVYHDTDLDTVLSNQGSILSTLSSLIADIWDYAARYTHGEDLT